MDELIRGLQAGRPEAFERLVRDYGDRIYRFVKRLAGERPAEDLTQEVFLRVHRSIESYRPEGRFESWLFTIANHLCIDHVRRRKPETSLSELDETLAPDRFASDARRAAPGLPPARGRRDVVSRDRETARVSAQYGPGPDALCDGGPPEIDESLWNALNSWTRRSGRRTPSNSGSTGRPAPVADATWWNSASCSASTRRHRPRRIAAASRGSGGPATPGSPWPPRRRS